MPDNGSAGRDDGIRRARQSANPEWKRVMTECLLVVSKRQQFLNINDVELLRRERFPGITTHEMRASGPIMLDGARQGWIKLTDEYNASRIATTHRSPRVTWESLIYDGPKRPSPRKRKKVYDPNQLDLGL